MDEASVRDLSFWHDSLPGPIGLRSPLRGDRDCDVAIVGAGFTGLWTAYHLALTDPSLRIMVLEREVAGFGASGRNGGWALGEYGASPMAIAASSTAEDAMRQMRALFDAVQDIGRVAEREGIDCHYARGGSISWARNAAQLARLDAGVRARHALGLTEDDIRMIGADEARSLGNASNVVGGRFMAHVAAIHPARLVRGLADAVERRGVVVHEETAVRSIGKGLVETDRGRVRADIVVRATEGYTRDLAGERRRIAPFYSLMVATEPLDEDTLAEVGLETRPTFADGRNMVIYGQRTADGRLAFGGRGAPYRYGSGIDPATERHSPVHDRIAETLVELFPVLAGTAVTHRWGGVLGIPRDWYPSVGLDRASGLAWAGGYAGDGVAAAKLAGHTLAELVTGTRSERTGLPWVDHRSRKWEPEPLRWLGITAGLWAARSGDRVEARTDRPARRVDLLHRLLR